MTINDGPYLGPEDFLREVSTIDDAAADDPTLRILGLDYLLGAANKKKKAVSNMTAAKDYFERQKWQEFRQELIIVARMLDLDVMDLPAFLPGKVTEVAIRRMVVQLATRALDDRLGLPNSTFAAVLGTRLIN